MLTHLWEEYSGELVYYHGIFVSGKRFSSITFWLELELECLFDKHYGWEPC